MTKIINCLDLDGNTYELTPEQLTWRPAAYGVLIEDSKILLMKEDNAFYVPGGGVDLGETPEQAVIS